jgi:ferrochelatase
MAEDGVKRAIAFVTSAFSSYSGCRQYRENIEAARAEAGPRAPHVDKLRVYYNHPGFIEPMAEHVRGAIEEFPASMRPSIPVFFTAHSIPRSMADHCNYERQLHEACRLVAERVGPNPWTLVYQSRSGAPHVPWLEPDVCDALRRSQEQDGLRQVVVAPIGFISDHMEVLFDLDSEADALCKQLGIEMKRAATVGTVPRFVALVRQLIEERLTDVPERLALGDHGPSHDVCPLDCCQYVPDGNPKRQ